MLAHQFAMESPLVEAEMIDARAFPDLADQFHVSGVPHTAINSGAGEVIGAMPENRMVLEIQNALNRKK